MARRSAQNPRYQKGKQVGTTRKSAASAKPKRSSGEAGGSGSSKKSSSDEKPKSRFFQALPVPDTPRFKRWRQIWLGLLVAAVVFSLAAWWQRGTQLGTLGLIAAYTCIFSAVYIDITKIRRMRKEYAEELDRKASKGKKK